MASDLLAPLAEIRGRMSEATFLTPALLAAIGMQDAPRLLAALDKVLELHAPTALVRYTEACPNHYAQVYGRLDCPDCRKVERNGCETCRDEYGNSARPEDCKERAAILAALTGKGSADA